MSAAIRPACVKTAANTPTPRSGWRLPPRGNVTVIERAALLRMLNPVEHARTPEDVERYKVEPYVVAADVYALEGQVGRGGWTWYTGSSGWMYRVWIEEILGFKLRGDRLTIDPVLPRDWPAISITFDYRTAQYAITVENPDAMGSGVFWVEVDGARASGQTISLLDDGGATRARPTWSLAL